MSCFSHLEQKQKKKKVSWNRFDVAGLCHKIALDYTGVADVACFFSLPLPKQVNSVKLHWQNGSWQMRVAKVEWQQWSKRERTGLSPIRIMVTERKGWQCQYVTVGWGEWLWIELQRNIPLKVTFIKSHSAILYFCFSILFKCTANFPSKPKKMCLNALLHWLVAQGFQPVYLNKAKRGRLRVFHAVLVFTFVCLLKRSG